MIRIIRVMMTYTPCLIKKAQLYFLFKITSEVFRCKKPTLWNITYDDALRAFARFTREQAEKTIQEGENYETIKKALYCKAFLLGAKIRRIFRLSNPDDVLAICRLFYKNIKIELEGKLPGEITIKSCYFSAFYSNSVCRFISALDEGIIAGLLGGSELRFEQRITEGSPCCRAFFENKENEE